MKSKFKTPFRNIINNTWITQEYFPYNKNPKAIIFFDRDDTLIKDFGDETHKKIPKFNLNFVACLKVISQKLNYAVILVIVTNQSRISSHKTSIVALKFFHFILIIYGRLLGIKINRIVTCPHSPLSECVCRKPSPITILNAVKDFNCTAIPKFMIGNSLSDIQAGLSAECFTIGIGRKKYKPILKKHKKLFLGYFTLKQSFVPTVLKIVKDKTI